MRNKTTLMAVFCGAVLFGGAQSSVACVENPASDQYKTNQTTEINTELQSFLSYKQEEDCSYSIEAVRTFQYYYFLKKHLNSNTEIDDLLNYPMDRDPCTDLNGRPDYESCIIKASKDEFNTLIQMKPLEDLAIELQQLLRRSSFFNHYERFTEKQQDPNAKIIVVDEGKRFICVEDDEGKMCGRQYHDHYPFIMY